MALHSLKFEFTDISTCDRTWNFGPRQKKSEILPAWALNGHLLTGFDLEAPHPVQNVAEASPKDAAVLLASIYHELSWPELVRFVHRPGVREAFDTVELFSAFGLTWNEQWLGISDSLVQWPGPVQDFISEKGIQPFDLVVLRGLGLPVQKDILTLLVAAHLSKSIFCQALELGAELILMGTSPLEVMEILKQKDLMAALKKKRFPLSTSGDEQFRAQMRDWPWAKGLSGQVQRQGDTRGIEIKFFAKNSLDLQKNIKNLQNVVTAWKKTEDDPAL